MRQRDHKARSRARRVDLAPLLAHVRGCAAVREETARVVPTRLPTGIRLLPYGERTASPDLAVIPGIDGSRGSVGPLVERLAGNRRVFIIDYSAARSPSLEALADAIAATIAERTGDDRHVREGPVDLLGQSIGCVLAALVSRQVDTRRIVLVGAFTRGRWSALRATAWLTGRMPRPLYERTTGPLMALACGPVGDGRDHPFFWWSAHSDPVQVARRTAWQVDRDFWPEFAAVEAPALALLGSADRFVPDVSEERAHLVRALGEGAEVRTIDGAGHVLLPSAAIAEAAVATERFLR